MTSHELRQKFLNFFESKDHQLIPSSSLVPENNPSVLFTTAGMFPLIPYLLGDKHPQGTKLVDVQKCIRTDDIDEVGDAVHHTFFEMLGNWSLGEYFKEESIRQSFEFLTGEKYLNISLDKLAFSVFTGDADAPYDKESYDLWLSLGIDEKRIAKLPKEDNWWIAGETGPCGPDTEIFYWTGDTDAPENFDAEDKRWVEIWNNVFMEYNRTADGKYEKLAQQNVDTGMGLERTLAVLNGFDDNYKTDLFAPIISEIEEISGKKYADFTKEFRIIADHIRAATFAINDGVTPSNKGAGYIVRRLIRRAIVKANQIGIADNFTNIIAQKVFEIYDGAYEFKVDETLVELEKEENKFRKTLAQGLKILASHKQIDGKIAFDMYQSYGLPIEIILEEAKNLNIAVADSTHDEYQNLLKAHQELSRTASAGMFKGGLADTGEETTKLHTAAHLLLAALRKVLSEKVEQKGSNITPERLRFDFSWGEKMTDEQIKEAEDLVNENIQKDLLVSMEEMKLEDAYACGAMGVFGSKYADLVKVYTISPSTPDGRSGSRDFVSREICGGPHVSNTGVLGHLKIIKEESSSAGVRRIKAILE